MQTVERVIGAATGETAAICGRILLPVHRLFVRRQQVTLALLQVSFEVIGNVGDEAGTVTKLIHACAVILGIAPAFAINRNFD